MTSSLRMNPPPYAKPVIPMSMPMPVATTSLPLNVATDLHMFNRISIVRQLDFFKIFHCLERMLPSYVVYGEMPDGDKKILFTVQQHFQCCKCCDQCILTCVCAEYVCCDQIIFQMDYKRNNAPFYTQGYNLQKGCYFCKCYCCICCPDSILYLRENIDPDSKDFNVGVQKGSTVVDKPACCACLRDKTAHYDTPEGIRASAIRAKCCDICKQQCLGCCTACFQRCGFCCDCTCDFEIDIEDGNSMKTGTIYLYSGCCSKQSEGRCCYLPSTFYDIIMPPGSTSEQKFQIIAQTIHFDLVYRVV